MTIKMVPQLLPWLVVPVVIGVLGRSVVLKSLFLNSVPVIASLSRVVLFVLASNTSTPLCGAASPSTLGSLCSVSVVRVSAMMMVLSSENSRSSATRCTRIGAPGLGVSISDAFHFSATYIICENYLSVDMSMYIEPVYTRHISLYQVRFSFWADFGGGAQVSPCTVRLVVDETYVTAFCEPTGYTQAKGAYGMGFYSLK